MTPDRPFRAAIIGTGAIAHAHAQAVHLTADALFDAEELDLVHVCTPPQAHVPLAIQALRAQVAAILDALAAGELTGDDPFVRSMSGGAVPWHPVKAHPEEAVA
jgi:ornithine cyclodeaminase/alanine dehydrogenase-like protein (mu-crystallin family)